MRGGERVADTMDAREDGIASLQGDAVPVFEPAVVDKLFFGPAWHREVV